MVDSGASRYKWLVFGCVAVGVFLSVLDTTMVSVALPSVSADLRADLPTVQWVVLIYLLATGALLMPLGRAADIFGTKRIYMAGFAVFIAGSILAMSSQSIGWLLGARVVHGAGSASLQAVGMAISVAAFPPEERGKVIGATSTIVALGAVVGPVFGGLLTDALGWRFVFLPGAVVGPIGLVLALTVLDGRRFSGPRDASGRLDWPGVISSAVLIVAALLLLSQGHAMGWTSAPTLMIAATAFAALAAFVALELRTEQPVVDLRLFKDLPFSLAVAASFLSFSAMVSGSFLMPFYLQGILGFEASKAGLMVTPMAAFLAVAGPVSGMLYDRVGPRLPTTLGMAVACASVISLTRLNESSSMWEILVPMAGSGAGIGLFFPSNNGSIVGAVGRERYGVVTAFVTLIRNVGQLVGVAVGTLIVTLSIASQGIEPEIGLLRTGGASPSLVAGFLDGFNRSYWVAASLMIAAGFLSAYRRQRRAAGVDDDRVSPDGVRGDGLGAETPERIRAADSSDLRDA